MAARYFSRRAPGAARDTSRAAIFFIFLLCGAIAANIYFNLEARHLSAARALPRVPAASYIPPFGACYSGLASTQGHPVPSCRVFNNAPRTHLFTVTAYEASRRSCGKWADGYTATMTRPREGRTIAVDRRVIPLGSRVWIEGVGWRIAEDVGGAIKGHRIDVYFRTVRKCLRFGKRKLRVRWIPPRIKLARRGK